MILENTFNLIEEVTRSYHRVAAIKSIGQQIGRGNFKKAWDRTKQSASVISKHAGQNLKTMKKSALGALHDLNTSTDENKPPIHRIFAAAAIPKRVNSMLHPDTVMDIEKRQRLATNRKNTLAQRLKVLDQKQEDNKPSFANFRGLSNLKERNKIESETNQTKKSLALANSRKFGADMAHSDFM